MEKWHLTLILWVNKNHKSINDPTTQIICIRYIWMNILTKVIETKKRIQIKCFIFSVDFCEIRKEFITYIAG